MSNETDPLDADSDDDGISDGDEAGYNTDPLDADTDNDGLPDGLEVGKAWPINPGTSNPWGIFYFGTDQFSFTPDADGGTTTTNPTDPDSDDDGLCDGNSSVGGICIDGEDQNTNGVVGANETDPNDDDSDDDSYLDGEDCEPLDKR